MHDSRVQWIGDAARALLDAERDRIPVPTLSGTRPDFDLEDAYRVQAAVIAQRISAGSRVVGHKAGATSKAMQEQMGVDEPDSGVLLDDMRVPTGAPLVRKDLLLPRVEAEIAFTLGRDLSGPDVTMADAQGAVSEVCLALEVIDTRYSSWHITVADSIADNASCARFVTGPLIPRDPAVDLAAETLVVSINGQAVVTGEGRAVLGNPYRPVVWLARRLAAHGGGLKAGDLILAGSVHASIPLDGTCIVRVHSAHLPAAELRVA
ncbi:2-keto-4-pentenoate hydratase [Streptomyces sp. N35]|uniref:2-keto-4-pentenoate hydratase n=1 Tax=Streptomyces sp. N35 TaxID=2795730 RepID=UPI0018F37A4A|nr:fumarylacetoacetate hydrolase family protein [Streptomyces sp. N35]